MMFKPAKNPTFLWKGIVSLPLIMFIFVPRSEAQSNQIVATTHEPCKIQSTTYEGWPAQQLSNQWLKLIIVPQLGGRVMQVTFADHPYLFVNPQLKGKHFLPLTSGDKPIWYNYGGDKIWPMPEGTEDDQHWPGPISDALDNGDYAFRILSQDSNCAVRLEGPPEPKTGLQYTRDISIDGDSPQIFFHAVMKNISTHDIRWSMQSVTQYDTADPQNPQDFNRDFWAFTPVHPQSAYLDGFHVRSGLADDPSFAVKNQLFTLHWLYLQNEVWIDSPAGWLAVVDAPAGFAMVERFTFQKNAEYPGKATVIFYKNGPSLEMNKDGMPFINGSSPEDRLHYMEAEINSPIVNLKPSETYAFDTKWFPARSGKEFSTVRDAGIIETELSASRKPQSIVLTGKFGIFVTCSLVALFYDQNNSLTRNIPLQAADPAKVVDLHQEIAITKSDVRISVHVIDEKGIDRGALGEVAIPQADQ
jgi:hypothetical protein